uniref:Uncharacterized protein n=1 Tax=Knipowitschia caucasica TaxID=637954 RepID=A0AAV2JRP0_KNICA
MTPMQMSIHEAHIGAASVMCLERDICVMLSHTRGPRSPASSSGRSSHLPYACPSPLLTGGGALVIRSPHPPPPHPLPPHLTL